MQLRIPGRTGVAYVLQLSLIAFPVHLDHGGGAERAAAERVKLNPSEVRWEAITLKKKRPEAVCPRAAARRAKPSLLRGRRP
jgi:hypothetical protein